MRSTRKTHVRAPRRVVSLLPPPRAWLPARALCGAAGLLLRAPFSAYSHHPAAIAGCCAGALCRALSHPGSSPSLPGGLPFFPVWSPSRLPAALPRSEFLWPVPWLRLRQFLPGFLSVLSGFLVSRAHVLSH